MEKATEQDTIAVNAQPVTPSDGDTGTAEAEPKLFAGKYKSTDDLENAYSELETRLGKQGGELGDLKKQNQALNEQLASLQSAQAGKEKAETKQDADYQTKIDDIYEQIDNGKISLEEGLRQSNALTAALVETMSAQKASQTVKQVLAEKDAENVQKQFLKDHPDFTELQKSGAFEALKQSNPLHDDFSAYFAIKAAQAKEEGKAELERLQKGAIPASKVLNNNGSAIRQQSIRPAKILDRAEMRDSMSAALSKVRSGG